MLKFAYTQKFLRDVRRLKKKHYRMELLELALDDLAADDNRHLARRWKDHRLQGRWAGYRELHVDADWLLVYQKNGETMTLTLMMTGDHDAVFRVHR